MTNIIHHNFRPEYDPDEPANDILGSMAGMCIPALSPRREIDLTPQDDLRVCVEYLQKVIEIIQDVLEER